MELKNFGIGIGAFALIFYGLVMVMAVTGWIALRFLVGIMAAVLFVLSTGSLIDMIETAKDSRYRSMTFGEWMDR